MKTTLFILTITVLLGCSILNKSANNKEKSVFNQHSKNTRFYYNEYYLEDIPTNETCFIEMKKVSSEIFVFSRLTPLKYNKLVEYKDTYQIKGGGLFKKIDNKFILLIDSKSKVENDKLIYTFPEKNGYDSSELFMNIYEIKTINNMKFYRFGFYGGHMYNDEKYDDYFCFQYGFIRKWITTMKGDNTYELEKIVSDINPKDTTFMDLKINWNSH